MMDAAAANGQAGGAKPSKTEKRKDRKKRSKLLKQQQRCVGLGKGRGALALRGRVRRRLFRAAAVALLLQRSVVHTAAASVAPVFSHHDPPIVHIFTINRQEKGPEDQPAKAQTVSGVRSEVVRYRFCCAERVVVCAPSFACLHARCHTFTPHRPNTTGRRRRRGDRDRVRSAAGRPHRHL